MGSELGFLRFLRARSSVIVVSALSMGSGLGFFVVSRGSKLGFCGSRLLALGSRRCARLALKNACNPGCPSVKQNENRRMLI